jgi:phosphodiesterase/alkaline phosphatase D-like protein
MKASAQMQIEPKSSRRKVISRGSLACAVLALAVAALSASQALATAAPAATTGPAQQVQFASATVSGTVNPSGAATSYYFEYGSTSAYGVQTSPTSAGAGTANVAVQQTLSGLAASTTYHYRLVATSPGGTAYGQDATFATTPTPAPAVTTGTATSVSFASASLTGSVNPEGVPTTYYFQYGATLAYGAKTAVESAASGTAPQAVTAPITGLAPATTYHYRLVAASAGGTVVGADATLTTTKTPAPLVATAAATAVGTTSATVNATVNPNGVASDYYFQYGTTSSYGRSTPSQSAGSGTAAASYSAALNGLAPGTTYHYRVVAVSAGGTVDGRDATFATAKTPVPTAVTGAASAVTTTTASLAGTIDPHGIATSYYFLYGTKSPSTRTRTASAGAGIATVAVSAALANLVPGTTYSYRLVGVGASTVTGTIRHFATAKIPASLSLTATTNPVAAGARVTVNGMLTGTGVGIRTVALQVEPYPYRLHVHASGPQRQHDGPRRDRRRLAVAGHVRDARARGRTGRCAGASPWPIRPLQRLHRTGRCAGPDPDPAPLPGRLDNHRAHHYPPDPTRSEHLRTHYSHRTLWPLPHRRARAKRVAAVWAKPGRDARLGVAVTRGRTGRASAACAALAVRPVNVRLDVLVASVVLVHVFGV